MIKKWFQEARWELPNIRIGLMTIFSYAAGNQIMAVYNEKYDEKYEKKSIKHMKIAILFNGYCEALRCKDCTLDEEILHERDLILAVNIAQYMFSKKEIKENLLKCRQEMQRSLNHTEKMFHTKITNDEIFNQIDKLVNE